MRILRVDAADSQMPFSKADVITCGCFVSFFVTMLTCVCANILLTSSHMSTFNCASLVHWLHVHVLHLLTVSLHSYLNLCVRVYLDDVQWFRLADDHPVHGELPNAPYQKAHIGVGSDTRGDFLEVGVRTTTYYYPIIRPAC